MERLTEYNKHGEATNKCDRNKCSYYDWSVGTCIGWCMDDCMSKLAAYEDLEEQGLLLRLPCPIGTDVYYILGIPGKTPCVIESTKFDLMDIKRIGVNMWITPEEAEAALAKMSK